MYVGSDDHSVCCDSGGDAGQAISSSHLQAGSCHPQSPAHESVYQARCKDDSVESIDVLQLPRLSCFDNRTLTVIRAKKVNVPSQLPQERWRTCFMWTLPRRTSLWLRQASSCRLFKREGEMSCYNWCRLLLFVCVCKSIYVIVLCVCVCAFLFLFLFSNQFHTADQGNNSTN